jgi:predicted DNA-binding protein
MSEKPQDQGTWTSVRLTKEERERLAAIARRENRKLAQQIRQFIYEGMERRERESHGERERGSHDLRAVR